MSVLVDVGFVLLAFVIGIIVGVRTTSRRYQRLLRTQRDRRALWEADDER